jgi:hypothetical protein
MNLHYSFWSIIFLVLACIAHHAQCSATHSKQVTLDVCSTETRHREYPLSSEISPNDIPYETSIELDSAQVQEPPTIFIPEPIVQFQPQSSDQEIQETEQARCTNSKQKALLHGACIGALMGFLGFKSDRFFPYNWFAGCLIRILLVSAITNPCTAKNKDLMRESAWTADWLMYVFLRLHKRGWM